MKKNSIGSILFFTFIIGIAVFSSLHYMQAVKAKAEVEKQFAQAIRQLDIIEALIKQERALQLKLNREKEMIEASLREAEELALEKQEEIFSLVKEMEALRKENAHDKEASAQLSQEVARLSEENMQLQAKLQSVPKLKKTVQKLENQRRRATAKANLGALSEKEQLRKVEEQRENNSGFLVKNGMTTYSSGVKIEVEYVK